MAQNAQVLPGDSKAYRDRSQLADKDTKQFQTLDEASQEEGVSIIEGRVFEVKALAGISLKNYLHTAITDNYSVMDEQGLGEGAKYTIIWYYTDQKELPLPSSEFLENSSLSFTLQHDLFLLNLSQGIGGGRIFVEEGKAKDVRIGDYIKAAIKASDNSHSAIFLEFKSAKQAGYTDDTDVFKKLANQAQKVMSDKKSAMTTTQVTTLGMFDFAIKGVLQNSVFEAKYKMVLANQKTQEKINYLKSTIVDPQEQVSDYSQRIGNTSFYVKDFMRSVETHKKQVQQNSNNAFVPRGIPCKFLDNVTLLAEQLEVLKVELKKQKGLVDIFILSGYRDPATNWFRNNTAGVSDISQHMSARAADIQVAGFTPQTIYNTIISLQKSGKMRPGHVGLYSNFVHYDVRNQPLTDYTKTGKPAATSTNTPASNKVDNENDSSQG